MAAVCVALLAGNLAWSLFESSELRGVAAQIRRRFLYRAE
jgi:hypothetical protein